MTDSGFKRAWRRAMAKHIAAGFERFRENDVRAKAASDADDLHAAQKLLAHESAATTQRYYRRGVAKNVPAEVSGVLDSGVLLRQRPGKRCVSL